MLCRVWRNIGYCQWQDVPEIKDVSKEELMEIYLGQEETTDTVVPMAEEPVKS